MAAGDVSSRLIFHFKSLNGDTYITARLLKEKRLKPELVQLLPWMYFDRAGWQVKTVCFNSQFYL